MSGTRISLRRYLPLGFSLLIACNASEPTPEAASESPPQLESALPGRVCSQTPRVLTELPGQSDGPLLQDAKHLYVAAGARIFQADKRGGGTKELGVGSKLIGVDGSSVVFASGDEGALHVADSSTGVSTALGVNLATYRGSYTAPLLAVANGQILWSEGREGGGYFYSLPLSGGAPQRHKLAPEWVFAQAFDAYGQELFWVRGDQLWKGAVPDASGAVMLANNVSGRTLVGASSDAVFLSGWDRVEGISRTGATSRVVTPFEIAPSADPRCPSVGKYGVSRFAFGPTGEVFALGWADCPGRTRLSQIWKAAAGSTPQVTLHSVLAHDAVEQLAADGSCVFWVENQGSVAKLMSVAH